MENARGAAFSSNSSSESTRGPPPRLLLLEHEFFRGLPGWGGPGTGGEWDDAELQGSAVAVPALCDALDVRHFDSRCAFILVVGVGREVGVGFGVGYGL